MAATVKQLVNRRKIHSIGRSAVAAHMGCTVPWLRFLEAGGVEGATLAKWRDRYEAALEELLTEKGRQGD